MTARVAELLRSRGPDYSAIHEFPIRDHWLTLCHTRLSIIDLNEHASQPFTSSCGRYSIVFNGEIYNYIELRERLVSHGYVFRTRSDTETLLNYWIEYGLTGLPDLQGMFAFSIYDKNTKRLFLARDAFGIKPLFFTTSQAQFAFCSDPRALVPLQPNTDLIDQYSAFRYLLSGSDDSCESTIYPNIYRILPGEYAIYDLEVFSLIRDRWFVAPKKRPNESLSFTQASLQLRDKLLSSIDIHTRSDTDIAFAVSGGLDSSAIVCGFKYLYPDKRLNTFSFLANDPTLSEIEWIRHIEEYLGIETCKVNIPDLVSRPELEDFISSQVEPVDSFSYFAEYNLYKCVSQSGYKVMLDGHGGDEVFCGYRGYLTQRITSECLDSGPLSAVQLLSDWSKATGMSKRMTAFTCLDVLSSLIGFRPTRAKIGLLLRALNMSSIFCHYKSFGLLYQLLTDSDSAPTAISLAETLSDDTFKYSCPKQLRGSDRSAMRFSVENRVPILNTCITDLFSEVPSSYLTSNDGTTKSLLRSAMKGIVPEAILSRRTKIGYETDSFFRVDDAQQIISRLHTGLERISFLDHDETMKTLLQTSSNSNFFAKGLRWRLFNLLYWSALAS